MFLQGFCLGGMRARVFLQAPPTIGTHTLEDSIMTPGELGGWIGGIVGGLCGLAGGIIGTWCSIRNTNGPRERAFMIRAAALCWIAILTLLALFFAVPYPYRVFLWIPFSILLPAGIIFGNRRQQAIRQSESQDTNTGAG